MQIESLAEQYRLILRVEKIGESAFYKHPIKAVVISDFPWSDEVEPAVLFTAAHHANEPIGVVICLEVIDYLCKHYFDDDRVNNGINHLEIWFVPVVNPVDEKVGQSALWMYHKLGTISFIIEAGDSYFPHGNEVEWIVKQNSKAIFWILDRAVFHDLMASGE